MDKKEAQKYCICGGCPSFVDCKEKVAFCFFGKSKCIKIEKGCLCGGCPIHDKMKFKKIYYCKRGKN